MPSPRKGAPHKRRRETGRRARAGALGRRGAHEPRKAAHGHRGSLSGTFGRKPLRTPQAGRRRLPAVFRRSQQSRAERLGTSLRGTGSALVARAGKALSKGRSKPGLVLVASAGAAAVAARRRRNTQAALEPLFTENEAPASEAHEGPPASPPAAPAPPAGESRAPITEG